MNKPTTLTFYCVICGAFIHLEEQDNIICSCRTHYTKDEAQVYSKSLKDNSKIFEF